jgi:hypothetical protein
MANRVLGNNTSFSTYTASAGNIVTSFLWNTLVATNFSNYKNVIDRFPAVSTGIISGSTPSSRTSWMSGSFVVSRHESILTSWTNLAYYTDASLNKINHIVPKNVETGPTVQNTWSNYWVFRTPGIYHIEAKVDYTVVTAPSMIRLAIVPYRNNGGNYHIISPFDSTYATNNYSLSSCLLSYTGKSDPNAAGTYTATISGFVLVTSQSMDEFPANFNNAINSTNPLTPGNGYHIELEGMYSNAVGAKRITINSGGTLTITLVQEWWK